jgi:hypothetical protein
VIGYFGPLLTTSIHILAQLSCPSNGKSEKPFRQRYRWDETTTQCAEYLSTVYIWCLVLGFPTLGTPCQMGKIAIYAFSSPLRRS